MIDRLICYIIQLNLLWIIPPSFILSEISSRPLRCLKLLLLLEEHPETDDCAIDEQATYDRHNHSRERDNIRMRQYCRQSCKHDSLAAFLPIFQISASLHPHSYAHSTNRKSGLKRKRDLPTPITTKNPVQNFPKSTTAFPLLSTKSSGLAHRPQIQLGSGANTYVATTSNGRYCLKSAQDRITRRKPIARTYFQSVNKTPNVASEAVGEEKSRTEQERTKEREMMVLRPAAIFAVDKGSLTDFS